MMSETCIVPNCKSGLEFSEKQVAYFNIPTNVELRNKWIEVIPKTSVPLNTTDMVCEKHFYETDVIRHYIVQDAAGNVVDKVAYDYPRLAETAVPSIFPGVQLRPNEPIIVQNGLQTAPPPAQTQNSSDILYDYMLLDAVSDVAAHTIAGGVDLIAKVAHHSQPPKVNEPEVTQVVNTNPSESHPLLGTDTNHDLPTPVNNDIAGDVVNNTTKSLDVFQNDDLPLTSEPVPIFVQPLSTFALSENAKAGTADGGDDGCCGGDDGCCGGDDGCCGGDDGCCGDDNCCDCGDCDCGDCDCGDCVVM